MLRRPRKGGGGVVGGWLSKTSQNNSVMCGLKTTSSFHRKCSCRKLRCS